MFRRFRQAQTVLEYAILITVVALALVAMRLYFQWAVNSKVEQVKEHFEYGGFQF